MDPGKGVPSANDQNAGLSALSSPAQHETAENGAQNREGSVDKRGLQSARGAADDDISSGLLSVKSLRQSIDVLREQQAMAIDVLANPQMQGKPEVRANASATDASLQTQSSKPSKESSAVVPAIAEKQLAALAAEEAHGEDVGPSAELTARIFQKANVEQTLFSPKVTEPSPGQSTADIIFGIQPPEQPRTLAQNVEEEKRPAVPVHVQEAGFQVVEQEAASSKPVRGTKKTAAVTVVEQDATSPKPARGPAEVPTVLAARQEQQDLRIESLQRQVRQLQDDLNTKFANLEQDVSSSKAVQQGDMPSEKAGFDRLDNELDAFRKELKAEQMKQSLSMVQESNTLRSDVLHAFRISLSNEREARCRDIQEVRSAIESAQDKLMQDLHMTMDLVGARLEDHLQESTRPRSLCAKLSGCAEFADLLKEAGLRAAEDLEADYGTSSQRTLPPDDMVVATASAVEELAKKLHTNQEASAKSNDDLRNMFVQEIASLQAEMDEKWNRLATTSNVTTSNDSRVQSLEKELEAERKTRSYEDSELSRRLEMMASNLEACTLGMEAATSELLSSTSRGIEAERSERNTSIQEIRQTLLDLMAEMRSNSMEEVTNRLGGSNSQDVNLLATRLEEEKSRMDRMEANFELVVVKKADGVNQELLSEREARTTGFNELRMRMEKDAADLRRRLEDQAARFDQASQQEREHRLAETSEIRTMLIDLVSKQVDRPSGDATAAPEGEILTLYGMVKEALGDTVRLSMEIEEERKQRLEECSSLRALVGSNRNASVPPVTAPPPARSPISAAQAVLSRQAANAASQALPTPAGRSSAEADRSLTQAAAPEKEGFLSKVEHRLAHMMHLDGEAPATAQVGTVLWPASAKQKLHSVELTTPIPTGSQPATTKLQADFSAANEPHMARAKADLAARLAQLQT